MAFPSHTDNDARISAAALRLAAASGWEKVTLEAVAKGAKIASKILKQRFATPRDLIPVIAAEIDREAFASLGNMSGTPHDILFDLLMARFDVLQKHRKAILNIGQQARHDRALARKLACANINGIYRVIDVAKITAPPRPALATGLLAIYSYAFWIWHRDDSRDMAKTMAAIDRALRYADTAVRFLKIRHS